jgi:hypothetical protein
MHIRVPVQNPDGSPAMPTKPSRARRMVRDGIATGHWNDAGIYYLKLVAEPSGRETQPIHLGCDPGKSFTGIGIQSKKATLYKAHLVLPFQRIKERLGAAVIKNGKIIKNIRGRALQRRVRRGRRIDRTVPFSERAHRQKRFSNRKKSKIPPSIRASRMMEIRVITELSKIYPINSIVYEVVQADVDRMSGRRGARSGKGFSPVMIAQYWAIQQLSAIAPVEKRHGWQKDGNGTSQIRKHLGLIKTKDKAAQSPESHAVDGVALAASQFVQYQSFCKGKEHGHEWVGNVEVTPSEFRVITRAEYFRRALHFDNAEKGGVRKRKGGTITPWGLRSGDKVRAEKAGKIVIGWVGGYSEVNKVISVYDHNWKRYGQFSVSKVQLIRRDTGLCVA